ncbi:hypothetical protein OIU74_005183 [Salix koriyanagi]|uniref:Uncharacterized protein n=1 Tax=Salix koriyanagi TaxID=2511006 RepID=A0A9Q0ZGB8_9ROSI|nr:hypothetical protein OIU74_005183 [Salix koriyanagi]
MDELACCLVPRGSSFSCSLVAEFELFSFPTVFCREGLRVWEFGQRSSTLPSISVAAIADPCVLVWESFIFWLPGVIFSVSVANWEVSRVSLSLFLLLPRSPCGLGGCPLFVGDAFCWALLRVEPGMYELACCLVLCGSSYSCSLAAEFELFSSYPSSESFIFWLSSVIFSVSVVNWELSRVPLSLLLLLPRSPYFCPLLAEILSLLSLVFGMWVYDKGCLVVAFAGCSSLGGYSLFVGDAFCWALLRVEPGMEKLGLLLGPAWGGLACVGVWAAFFCFPPLLVATVVDLCVLVWESFIFWLSSVIFSVSVANWELSRVPLSLYLLLPLAPPLSWELSSVRGMMLFVGLCCVWSRGWMSGLAAWSCVGPPSYSLAAEFDLFSFYPSFAGRACVCGSLGNVLLLSFSFGVLQEYFILWLPGVIFSFSACELCQRLLGAGFAGCSWLGGVLCSWVMLFAGHLLRVEPGMDELACCLVLRGSSYSCSLAAEFELFSSHPSSAGRACVCGSLGSVLLLSPLISVATVVDPCVLVWVSSRSLSSSGCQVSSSRLPSLVFGMWGSDRGCLVLALLVVAGLGAIICSWVMLFAGLLLRVEPGMDELACCLVLRGSSYSCSLAAEFETFLFQAVFWRECLRVWEFGQRSSAFPSFGCSNC